MHKSRIEHLLILGCGYVGERLAVACLQAGVRVTAVTRSSERAALLSGRGVATVVSSSPAELPDELLAGVDAVLDSIPLSRNREEMRASQSDWVPGVALKLSHIKWAGYLSTTGVYGDAGGAWVDESFRCRPTSRRGIERLKAETAWLKSGLPAEVFRLAGIYGPGRNMLERLKAGGYRTVQWNPPHYSSRIHIDDIVAALMAAMQKPKAGRVINLADDLPLPHADYVCELAEMTDAERPEILSESEGELKLPPAALAFFRDNKRVSNRLLHRELLPELNYPSFRDAVETMMD